MGEAVESPMVVLEVSGRKPACTSVGQLSESWEFNEEFFFPVNNVETDKITISLVNHGANIQGSKRFLKAVGKIVVDTEVPKFSDDYVREKHLHLAETVLDINGFNGSKEEIDLHHCGSYRVVLIGKLYHLAHV